MTRFQPLLAGLAATLVWTSCNRERIYWACPEVRYVQAGPAIEDVCDCTDGVALWCRADYCVGQHDLTCEDPEAVSTFFQTECSDCFIDVGYGGEISVQCDEYWP